MNVDQNTGNLARLSPEEQALQDAAEQRQQLIDSNQAVGDWWASLPPGRGPVIGGEPTGPLSLAERADRGLLADNPDWLPAQDELPFDDVLWLEHPTDTERRAALAARIRTAIDLGLLVTHQDKPGVMQRDHYRQWRAQCPKSLLSELIQIHLWLGEQPNSSPVSVGKNSPEPVTKPKKRHREDDDGIALVAAENAALAALRKELKHEPTANQWLNYWRSGKDTDGAIREVTSSEVVWIGKDNEVHRTALTTMNTRFSKAKKRNPFTPS